MRHLLLLLAALAALGLAACGEESDPGGDAAENPPQESESAQPEPAEKKPTCQQARKVLVDALESSLTIGGGGGLKRVSVVKVEDPPDAPLAGYRRGVYAVAGEFTGEGMDGTIGIWAVSRDMVRTGGGLAIGADTVTREFSELGAAASGDSPAADYAEQIADSEAGQRAQECADGS